MLPGLDISWVGRSNREKTGGSRPGSEGFDILSVGQDIRLFFKIQSRAARSKFRLATWRLLDLVRHNGLQGRSRESERSRKAMETLPPRLRELPPVCRSGKRTKPKGNGDRKGLVQCVEPHGVGKANEADMQWRLAVCSSKLLDPIFVGKANEAERQWRPPIAEKSFRGLVGCRESERSRKAMETPW